MSGEAKERKQSNGGNAWEQFSQYLPPYGGWSEKTLDLLRAAWLEDIRREVSRAHDAGSRQETAPAAGDGVPRSQYSLVDLVAERDGYHRARDDAWAKLDAADAEKKKLVTERDMLRSKLESAQSDLAVLLGKLAEKESTLRQQMSYNADRCRERDEARKRLDEVRKAVGQ